MKVSIVILNWNGEKMLNQFLHSVCDNSKGENIEVVVADNASTDGSISLLKEKFPEVKLILLDKNYGFAEGYNRALAELDSQYFILLNSDVEVTDGWLTPLIEYMDANENVAACQPKILSYNDKLSFEHAGAAGGFIDKYGYPFCRGRIFDTVEQDNGQYDTPQEIFWATGACLFIRASTFKENGGLDSGFFAHMEEIDLCWRLKSRGYTLMCIPQSKVYHVGGGTLNMGNPRKTYLNFRNNILMIYKNEPQSSLRKVLFVRYFLDYISAFSFLLKGDLNNFKAIFKARHEYCIMKKSYESKRLENMKHTVKNSSNIGKYNGSIVYAYFASGLKYFSQLPSEKLNTEK